jgi:hypothetical protein
MISAAKRSVVTTTTRTAMSIRVSLDMGVMDRLLAVSC